MAYCRNCGKKISDDARFCTNCGAAVDTSDDVQEPEETELEDIQDDFSEYGYGDLSYEKQQINAKGKKRKKKGKRKTWLIAAVVIAVLCLYAGGSRKNKTPETAETLETEDDRDDAQEAASAFSDEAEGEGEENAYTEYSIDGITFTIPTKYVEKDGGFESADGRSGIFIADVGNEMTDDQFDEVSEKLDEKMDEYVAEMFTSPVRKSALESETAGFKARSYFYTGEMNGYQMTAYLELINVTEKEKLLMVAGVAEESAAEGLETDYKIVLDSAKYTNASDTVSATTSTDDSASSASETSAPAGVDPDLAAFLDEYEAFVDKYVEFMQKYQANPSDLTLLTEYAEMMQEYVDFTDKIDAYESDSMSAADASYYLEVTTRCSQKMLGVLGSMED